MEKLAAYFDESGHANDPLDRAFAVAGCVAPVDQWDMLVSSWNEVLRRFGLSAFHAKDFAHSRKEFQGWENHEDRRREFMGALIALIKNHVTAAIGAAVPIFSYRALTAEQQDALQGPYFLCIQACLGSVATLGAAWRGEKVEVVFARAPKLVGKADALYKAFLAGPHPLRGALAPEVRFASPKDLVPLQIADLVVYELARLLEGTTERFPMRELLALPCADFQFFPHSRIVEGFE